MYKKSLCSFHLIWYVTIHFDYEIIAGIASFKPYLVQNHDHFINYFPI